MRLWGWSPHDGISVLIKRDTSKAISFCLSFSLPQLPISAMWGHHKRVAVCKAGCKFSLTPHLAGILIFSSSLHNSEKYFLLFKSPSLWYFVMTARQTKTGDTGQIPLFLHKRCRSPPSTLDVVGVDSTLQSLEISKPFYLCSIARWI